MSGKRDIASVADDLADLVAVIYGSAALLSQKAGEPDVAARHVQVIETAAERIARAVDWIAAINPKHTPDMPDSQLGALLGARLLVCDPDSLRGARVAGMMEAAGATPETCRNADEAASVVFADPGVWDCLIAPVTAQDLDGPDLVKVAREIRPALPCVLHGVHDGARRAVHLAGATAQEGPPRAGMMLRAVAIAISRS